MSSEESPGRDDHDIAAIFPLIEGAELQNLAEDIKQHGLLEPVVLYEGKILDGRNRSRACQLAGVKPRYEEFRGTPEEAIARVWSLNFERRHLTSSQRACCDTVRNKLLDSYRAVREAAKERQLSGKGMDGSGGRGNKKNPEKLTTQGFEPPAKTRDVRAKAAGTNAEYIDMADKLYEEQPEVFKKVQKGEKMLTQVKLERQLQRLPERRAKAVRESSKVAAGARGENDLATLTIEKALLCAKENRWLSDSEIGKITRYSDHQKTGSSSIHKFLIRCSLLPWLKITHRNDRSEHRFVVDQYLKALCDGRVPLPSADVQAVIISLDNLRKEIDRQRKEAKARRFNSKWNPETAHTAELVLLLNFIEAELDKLCAEVG
jgi:hypothetical protein